MKKLFYTQPEVEVGTLLSDSFVMIQGTGDHPDDAPARRDVAPAVPGEGL